LDVRGLSVELGGRPVLTGVDLAVEPGELVGLLGPNGAGKTTLLRAILGLLPPAAGSVHVAGKPGKPGRTPIGYVPQRHDFAFDFPISVVNAVATGLTGKLGPLRRLGAADWEAVADALDRVRMAELADRPIGQISGGQRQRVLVARALALRPSVLLLDEPFTGMDLPTQELLAALFADLAQEGRAVLLTTHDIGSALCSCDRIALLNRSVVATGTPGDLADDPEPWMATFAVGPGSALLRMLKAV
jgi:manganese/iron transport system ATP-binding protein